MTRVPTATGSGDSQDTVVTTRTSDTSHTTELGERDEVVITVAEATSYSTILSEDDDAPAKPRYQPGDVIIEHDDLVDADIPPPSLESKVGINISDIDELVGDSAYRGMLVVDGARIAPRFAWISTTTSASGACVSFGSDERTSASASEGASWGAILILATTTTTTTDVRDSLRR